MPRETVEQKALRYLLEERVQIVLVSETEAEAEVKGSGPKPYRCRFFNNAWTCDCEARVECAHLKAVRLVVKLEPSDLEFETDVDLDAFLDVS